MESISPSKTPFITATDDNVDDGPTSPFHAMDDEDGILVKANDSDISMPAKNIDEEAEKGILMVKLSDSSKLAEVNQEQIDALYDDDNNSINSTLKVHQGSADFDYDDIKRVTQSKWEFGKTKRSVIKVLYMSVFAMFGALVRMLLAQLFGEECRNPGTIGWLKAGQPLCVTADGETSISGGIIFADFPANLLGSFIMGFMQGTDTMDLPKTLPIAWLNENHPFQSYDIIHLAIKTGFCGSLTTFSSWNSEMVMMMLGEDADKGSLIFRALFGYLIGVETCIASFILGQNIAKYIFANVNPVLHKEAAETARMKEHGVYINTELSDYERRYLSGFDMGEYEIFVSAEAMHHLEKWKVSTDECRRNGHRLLPLLTDVEYQKLVLDETLTQDLIVPSVAAGWDIVALENWVHMKRELEELKGGGFLSSRDSKFIPAALIFFTLFTLCFFTVFFLGNEDAYTITYRTMLYACLLAPTGALLRWKLSGYNGRISKYNWFPLGTFGANVLGSLLSAAMIALETHMYGFKSFWAMGSVRAIKVGFTGCLSTVSTFVAEASGFLKSSNPIRAYVYIILSIVSSAAVGAIAFTLIHTDIDYY